MKTIQWFYIANTVIQIALAFAAKDPVLKHDHIIIAGIFVILFKLEDK